MLAKLPSLKPPADELPTDEQKRAWEMSVRYTDEFGNKRVNGGENLKASQAYPRQRGSEVHSFDMTCMQGRRRKPCNDGSH